MRTLKLAVVSFLVAASFVNADDTKRKFIIAAEAWPPMEYIEDGETKGINVEVITRIMKRLDVSVEFQFYPFTRSWMMAEKGKVDAISSISYQPNREAILFYTEAQKAFLSTGKIPENYLWNAEYAWFIHRRNAPSFHSKGYDDLSFKDYNIGIVKSYSYNKEFRDADLKRKTFPSADSAFQAMAEGLIDLVPMEVTVGEHMIMELGLAGKISCLEPNLFSKPYYLAFTQTSDYPDIENLSKRFHEELSLMRASGEYASIYESYIRPQYVDKITRPLVFVCEEWAPLEYMDGKDVIGVDASVVKYIMTRLGIPYKIEIYPWSRAWMMAEKGKVEAVLSVSYKDTREEVLFYTEDQRQFGKTGKTPEHYLWMSEYVFFVMKKSANDIVFTSYNQLKKDGVKIGRNRDYSYNPEFLAAEFVGPVYANTDAGIFALVNGEIDLYPMDKTVGVAVLKKLGLQNSVSWLPQPLFSKPYLSPFCRKSKFPELEKIMNAFYRELRIMRSDGTYDKIYHASIEAIEESK